MLSSIPSPSSPFLPGIGIRYYGLMIALGVLAGVTLARRRWKAAGHNPDEISDVAVWAVPAGLIGARLYHVITDWNDLYSNGRWMWRAFEIWNGGLGIPGGIALGTLVGVLAARRYKIDVKRCADAMVPAIPLAQAIGRFGNYFNQELYGRPSTLPWAIEIDADKRPNYPNASTFQPTFAYEALWNLGVVGLLIWIDSKKVLRPGKLLPTYVILYFTGRLWVEALRSDHANTLFGLRINTVVSLTMMLVGSIWLMWGGAMRPILERGSDGFGTSPNYETNQSADEEPDADDMSTPESTTTS